MVDAYSPICQEQVDNPKSIENQNCDSLVKFFNGAKDWLAARGNSLKNRVSTLVQTINDLLKNINNYADEETLDLMCALLGFHLICFSIILIVAITI